jgi:hypothetical protein
MTLPMDEVKRWVTAPLEKAGISDYSLWWIDVPEFLRDPHELYVRLSLPLPGEAGAPGAPEYRDIEGLLGNIFERHSTPRGIILRQQRLLWQAYLPKYDEAQAKK